CFSNAGGLGTGDGGAGLCPGGDPNQNLNAGAAAPCGLDGCDHGTHVAGIAAGKAYSGMDGGSPQFSGVAPDAQIIAIQVFTQFGTDVGTYSTDQASALDYINTVLRTQFNVAAVNMSLGGTLPFSTPCDASQTLRKTSIDNLRSHGIATVIASGNSGFTNGLSTPACISTAVSVGSTRDGGFGATPVDTVSSFSNSASYLSLLAPGQLIRSSVPGGLFSDFQGTSMAAPHVAGAWAVLKEARPTASVSEILALLQSTGLAVTDARNGFTQSRIQLDAALSDQLPYFTSTAYAFGRVTVDLSSQASVTLQNPLSVPITVTTPSLSGTGLSLSASTCPAGGRLAAGGTCALTVKYAPSAPATLSGTLNLVYTPTATFSAGALQATFSGQAVELCADNLLNNAVFERVDASWVQTDTVAGAALPLCPPSGCPLGGFGPAGPYSGGGWALFGAYTDTITATTTVTQRLLQSVVVPANSLSLQFVFAISRADPGSGPADRFEAWLDNTRVFTATAADRPQYAQYSTVRISLPPVALPVTRTLTFSATTQLTGPVVDFNLDDVALCSPAFFPIYLPNVSRGQ
ncbi:MAG: S8 family serine peptidase, partial [Anaerolineales bacterium]|nr:S8 family serine peptidase [Anaerolineales bacterium]